MRSLDFCFVLSNSLHSHSPSLRRTGQLQQFWENWSTEASCGIPSLGNGEPSSITSNRASAQDICESLISLLVQPWVEETERSFALGDEGVIDEGDDAREQRGGSAGAGDDAISLVPGVGKVETLSGNVGVCTAGLKG